MSRREGDAATVRPLLDSEVTQEALLERLSLYRLAYRNLRDALDSLPCTNPRDKCEELDAAGKIEGPEDWCIRCAALGNANDIVARIDRV